MVVGTRARATVGHSIACAIMNVSVLPCEPEKLAVLVTDISMAMQNLIRHALLADVPVQAVDRVTFNEWDGPVESSFIAHRMGQLPIRGTDPLEFEVNVTAKADAPLTWITSNDITGDGGRVVKGTEDGTSFGFLLVPLLAGQRAHLTCHTTLGTGRKHAIWNSVFPVVKRREDGSATFLIETTGAITPKDAWIAALSTTRDIFTRISSL